MLKSQYNVMHARASCEKTTPTYKVRTVIRRTVPRSSFAEKYFIRVVAQMGRASSVFLLLIFAALFTTIGMVLCFLSSMSACTEKVSYESDLDMGVLVQDTLTKAGKNLNLNMSTCPPGSIMTRRNRQYQRPRHKDCPDLFIIGVRKGGTTSLIQYLSKHPQFSGPLLDKGPMAGETFYFLDDDRHNRVSWKRYKRLFPAGKRKIGESTVDYFEVEAVPQRIYESCGSKPKIVVLLREPVGRFVSNFVMKSVLHSDYGTEAITPRVTNETRIHDVVAKEIEAFKSRLPEKEISLAYLLQNWSIFRSQFAKATSMLFHGLYYVHVMNWFCNYPAENILIINSEEFFTRPSAIVKQVSQFIGLRALPDAEYNRITAVAYNKGGYSLIPPHHQISVEDRARLAELYKPFNTLLLTLLEWPLNWD